MKKTAKERKDQERKITFFFMEFYIITYNDKKKLGEKELDKRRVPVCSGYAPSSNYELFMQKILFCYLEQKMTF